MASGVPVHILILEHTGKCNKGVCHQILGTVQNNVSDLGLHRGYYVADTKAAEAGIDHMWHIGRVTMMLFMLEEGLLNTTSDIFMRNLTILGLPCLVILMGTLAIFVYLMLRTQDSALIKLQQAVLGFFFMVGQQNDGYLMAACDRHDHGRVMFLITLIASMLCLTIYEAQLAAQIATPQDNKMTLGPLNREGAGDGVILKDRKSEG